MERPKGYVDAAYLELAHQLPLWAKVCRCIAVLRLMELPVRLP